ncbi:MAG: hypothetical protein GXP38_16345 [Chloroflexi bacterium]|nr:hypothetical protein [Chloroflexota bacterium]
MIRYSFYLMNIGILLVVVSPWFHYAWLVLIGRSLETAAVVFYAVGSWRRVKSLGA